MYVLSHACTTCFVVLRGILFLLEQLRWKAVKAWYPSNLLGRVSFILYVVYDWGLNHGLAILCRILQDGQAKDGQTKNSKTKSVADLRLGS